MIGVQLQPVDTWFFRGGTPFTMYATPQEGTSEACSPRIRRRLPGRSGLHWRLARVGVGTGHGRGRSALSSAMAPTTSVPSLWMARSCSGAADRCSACPAMSLVCPRGRAGCRAPSCAPALRSLANLGDEIRLPEVAGASPDDGKLKPGDSCWLTQKGINAVLHGRLPSHDDLVPESCLWSEEPRIGLERDGTTRAALEGMLYSTRHVPPPARRLPRSQDSRPAPRLDAAFRPAADLGR